jgi:bifunctional non-homologous end joining protein LigD
MGRAAAKIAQPEKPARQARAAGDLTRYKEKRDFTKTPEPSGVLSKEPFAEGLRFVIQKHAARRLHYDLRLELGGVYKSWAVTRGPSLDPHEKRLAVHVEDHPIDYGDFEGIIPKGEYGGGTVMIWDRGTWKPEGDPDRGYEKGHLAFELDGEKLHGKWHLIRTKERPGQTKEQWLLFKSEDAFAREGPDSDVLETQPDSVATHRSMDEIASEKAAVWSSRGGLIEGELSSPAKDVPPSSKRAKSGAKKKPADKLEPQALKGAKKAPFPGFVEPCLALLMEKPPEGGGWLHEIKFDGYRLMALLQKGKVKLLTRSGLDWTPRFPGIAQALNGLSAASAILDGEAVIEDEAGISSFSALQDALSDHRPAAQAIFQVFDLLYLDGYDLRGATLDGRKGFLASLLAAFGGGPVRYSDHMIGNGQAMLENACRLGLEGIVSKRRDKPYRSGRHGEWAKAKCTNREEFVIGGYAPSTATRNSVGSLALGYYDRGELIHAGRTGTGFTQKSARALYELLQTLRTAKSPFVNILTSEERRGLVFVEPKLVAEIEFRGWTGDRHLRHAAFKGLREDKPAEEVELEMPRKTDSEAKETKGRAKAVREGPAARARAASGGAIEFAGVKLTHPDRILWQGQGLTKLGLAEYYAGVADLILPHITERPLALVRCPNGSDGQCFFQKHAFAGLTDAVEVVPVPEKDGEAETLVIHDLRGLITLVQASVLEIHPWGARIGDPEHPDTLIFDLDPGEGLPWTSVIEAARDIRRRLQELGIESFVKTTGGKGLHVMCPVEKGPDWDALKDFAHAIALSMESDAPGKYVSTMAKKARGGKIYIDYLRNGRGATAVAAYSTRARPGAPISTPIRWDELGPELTPARFNISNIGRRLASLKRDPWEGFVPQPVAKAIRALKSRAKTGKRG